MVKVTIPYFGDVEECGWPVINWDKFAHLEAEKLKAEPEVVRKTLMFLRKMEFDIQLTLARSNFLAYYHRAHPEECTIKGHNHNV